MPQDTVAFYIGQIIGAAIGVPIGAFLGALVLRWATKWLAKVVLRYWSAYKVVVIVGFVGYVAGLLIGYLWTHSGGAPGGSMLLGLVAGVPLSGWLYGTLIQRDDGTPIGFGLGFKLAAVFTSFLVGILIIIGGIAFLASREPSGGVSVSSSAPPPQNNFGVEAANLSSIQVFDGSIPWKSDGRKTMYSEEVKGRVRNGLGKPITRVKIYVQLKNPSDETIETMRFDLDSVNIFAPLMPGDARSWTHNGWWERLPKDMTWSWSVIEADYASP